LLHARFVRQKAAKQHAPRQRREAEAAVGRRGRGVGQRLLAPRPFGFALQFRAGHGFALARHDAAHGGKNDHFTHRIDLSATDTAQRGEHHASRQSAQTQPPTRRRASFARRTFIEWLMHDRFNVTDWRGRAVAVWLGGTAGVAVPSLLRNE